MANIVFIATSLDGYIADKEGNLDWLHSASTPEGNDMGFSALMERVDGLIMGRNTLDTILSFGVDWPYSKPVFVLSHSMTSVPKGYEDKIVLIKGELKSVLNDLNKKGFIDLYIDGGITIQNFLAEDLIDELILTSIPVLLGGGSPLFGNLSVPLNFELVESQTFNAAITQSQYVRKRTA